MASAASTMGSPSMGSPAGSRAVSRGPHAAHAMASAWKRRSVGSVYSDRHAAHIANGAIVVRSRSYGAPVTIVSRGPQAVHVINGYRYRRLVGSNSSCRHASQVAASADTTIAVV